MSEHTKQETRTDAADVQATKLDLNKDTLQDLDAPAGDPVKGGAIPSLIICHSDLCVTTTGVTTIKA